MSDNSRWAAQVGWIAAFAALLVWPMIYNGFPLVFSDTGAYLASGIERFVPNDRPAFYGAFLAVTSRLGGLPFAVIAQALCVAYVAWQFLMWTAPHASRLALAVACIAIALLTPAAWLTSWLMPDVFGSLVVLIAILFVLGFQDLRLSHRVGLAIILLLALLTHTGNLLLFGGVVIASAVVGALSRLRISWRGATYATVIALTAALLTMLSNALAHGRWTINPGSQAFLAARLVGDGLMKPYLDRHCPSEPGLPLCAERDRLQGMTNNNFLWDSPSLAATTGAWDRRAADYSALNARVLRDNVGAVLNAAAGNTLELLGRSQIGEDPLDPNFQSHVSETSPTRRQIERLFPGELAEFLTARQQTERLNLYKINRLHQWWTWISYVLFMAAVIAAYRTADRRMTALLIVVGVALVLNAAIHATLSGVYTRYQVKVTWLTTLAAFAALLAPRSRVRMSGGAGTSKAGR